MAKLINVGVRKFRKNVMDKKIILWGAGRLAPYYIQTFCRNLNIVCIIDRNENLCGKNLTVDNINYPVITENVLLRQLKNDELQKDIAVFITPTSYAGEIIKHINTIKAFDTVECYAGVLLRDFYEATPFKFSQGKDKIPKKIHYCWFGGKEIPDHLKTYMESWRKLCPDYEIIRWDESSYDISKNQYMKEAYECGKWGFVPDYARLDIIYNEGGIYLDTDVEVIASLDRLLKDDMFCGFSCNYQIGFGIGFGAIKKHPLIKELRDYYDNLSFYLQSGKLNLKTCYEYQHPVLQDFGFKLENRYQRIRSVALYPSEVLSPDIGLVSKNYTENTIAVHHFEYSWANEEERKALERFKNELDELIIAT